MKLMFGELVDSFTVHLHADLAAVESAGFALGGHNIDLHFVVNDIFMSLSCRAGLHPKFGWRTLRR